MDSSGDLVFAVAVAGQERVLDPLDTDTAFVLASGGSATSDVSWMRLPASQVLGRAQRGPEVGLRLVRSLPAPPRAR
jgi:hypothetical protein